MNFSATAAYVLRSLGEQTDGEKIAPEIKRIFDFVSAKSIVSVFERHGYFAKAYCGDVETLRQRLAGGVPVIVFVSIPGDTHYAVVTGYGRQYLPEATSGEKKFQITLNPGNTA